MRTCTARSIGWSTDWNAGTFSVCRSSAVIGLLMVCAVCRAGGKDAAGRTSSSRGTALAAAVPGELMPGADACDLATVTPVPVGPTGVPFSVTIQGDNTSASGPDCSLQAPDPLWWEAFSLASCGRVLISLCGTTPPQIPSYAILFDRCPCGERIRADAAGRYDDICADGNLWMEFDALPAGTYYLPIFSDEGVLADPRGPYTITISASGCLGACCHVQEGTCEEGVAEEACAGPFDAWSPVERCCEAECRRPDQTFAANGVQLLSHVPLDVFPGDAQSANDVWGYVSPAGRAYALVGLSVGTGIVDVTDPFHPFVLTTVPHAPSIWTDMAVFDEFAYSVNESGDGMQIIDLRGIDDGVVSLVGSLRDAGVRTAHNVYVNEDSGFAYLCGSNVASGGLLAVDVSDPSNPRAVGAWTDFYVHDTQVVTYTEGPNAGREIAFNFCGQWGIRVVDVTDKNDMHTIGTGLYPGLTFAHQGWLSESRNFLFVDDELDELQAPSVTTATTYVLDVSALVFPTFVTSFTNGVCSIDHNLMLRGRTIYAANYTSGLRVFDAFDPLAMSEVGFFDTHPEGNETDFKGAWGVFAGLPSGVVLVSDIERGLFVVNYDCNGNGVVDTDDIGAARSADCNANGLPDECEYLKPGDLDLNRLLNADDEAIFTRCLSGPTLGGSMRSSTFVEPCCVHADRDADGDVDLHDLQLLRSAFRR